MSRVLACWLAVMALTTTLCASPPQTLSVERLQNIRLLVPEKQPKAVIVYLSDRSGWSATDEAFARALREDGSVVLSVDLSIYAKALDASSGECLYVVGEITDLAQTTQRELGVQTYLPPIVIGRGEGATFAYAALADAPANTLGGAVAMDFADRLSLRLPFCPGATATKMPDGGAYRYAFDRSMPGPATIFVRENALDDIAQRAAPQPSVTVEAIDQKNPVAQVVEAVSTLTATIEPFGTLPAVDLPSTTTPRAVAIFVSGDGGWRDLDKSIGEWLSTQAIHVIGLDALHYFWSKRTPEELADDVSSLIHDADPDGSLPVLLLGYSFGADTLPFAFPYLPSTLRGRTRLIALLGPGKTTSFQVTISGWLGIDEGGYDVTGAIARLPPELTLCVYGKADAETSCNDPKLTGITLIETEGGHHFDADYIGLARRILDRTSLP
ncbi:virulence factor family protein [Pseudaminobacter sp. 19-2017]|uniref:Virulence factor family protein n=1 Tax=Pseudaminobacter soli (ex Zhang et al. 2022) TaxID=2831468 RepID=A0A942I3W9_9HYPH|nr:virulence factor family protein [Pseudaminobacter soli]MBS3651003.1 virulence factor family protein [Pseudaminobacter soli]